MGLATTYLSRGIHSLASGSFCRFFMLSMILIAGFVCAVPSHAQSRHVDPYRFWKWPKNDALALGNALGSKRTLYALGIGGALYFVAQHDAEVSRNLSHMDPPGSELITKVVDEFGNIKAIRPITAVIFLGSLMTDSQRVQDAAFTSLEAVLLSNLLTNVLKTAVGRSRPYEDKGPMHLKPFSGSRSFPSGHSATAFALVTPWLLYYPNTLAPGLLVLSVGTAFGRVVGDHHWFTDIVAGSTLGFVTAYWLTRRHQEDSRRIRLAPDLSTNHVGLRVQVFLGRP